MPCDLTIRGLQTAVACWELFAAATPNAAVLRLDRVDVAVFPGGPEREVYNNAVLGDGVDEHTLAAMEEAYAAAAVDDFAAWCRASDAATVALLRTRGYVHAETTHAMARTLGGELEASPALDLVDLGWAQYAEAFGLPSGLLTGVDPAAVALRVARWDGRPASTALGFRAGADCGIFNVTTVEAARRRGLARALTMLVLREAAASACTTATLQATPEAVALYRGCGFTDLGRILEFRPGPARAAS